MSETCRGKSLAPNETCTINVGFKPTRTNTVSVARVVVNSNADDAMERILIAGTSTGDATVTPAAPSRPCSRCRCPRRTRRFGTFVPAVARTYETAVTASVLSTAGDAALSVSDPSTTAPGHLTNGAFSLPQPLQVRAANAATPSSTFAPLSAAATPLLAYTGPVNGDAVTIGFRQAIGAGDVLRSGTYAKSVTFALSTTTP